MHDFAQVICVFRVTHHEVVDGAVLQTELLRVCLAASISFPVECDDETIGEALGDHDLMAYVVGELHDLVVRMRPEWLDNEDTSLTIKAFLDEAEYQTFKGLVAMKEDSYTFDIEG